MVLWHEAVEVLRESMVAYAHATNGNLAAGILIVTVLARLAMFPLMLRLARASTRHQERLRGLQPELDAIKARFKHDPVRLAEETRRAFTREGIPMLPIGGLLGSLAPAPVLLALYSAVRQCAALGGRFLWIADISRPDRMLAVVVAAIAAVASLLAPQMSPQQRSLMTLLPAFVTLIVLWKLAAGIGLYWGVSSAVGGVQSFVSARYISRPEAA